MRLGNHLRPQRMRVEATLAVGVDVELDLAHTGVKLRGQWMVLIVEAFEALRVFLPPKPGLAGRNPGVVTVVRADDLNLVDLQCVAVRLRPERRGRQQAGHGGGQGNGRNDTAWKHEDVLCGMKWRACFQNPHVPGKSSRVSSHSTLAPFSSR